MYSRNALIFHLLIYFIITMNASDKSTTMSPPNSIQCSPIFNYSKRNLFGIIILIIVLDLDHTSTEFIWELLSFFTREVHTLISFVDSFIFQSLLILLNPVATITKTYSVIKWLCYFLDLSSRIERSWQLYWLPTMFLIILSALKIYIISWVGCFDV